MDGLYDPRCRRVVPAAWVHCDQCPAISDTWDLYHLVPVEIVLEEDQEDDE